MNIFLGLAKLFVDKDVSLFEINPLVITANGNLLCLDATLGAGYHFADYSGRFSEKGRLIPSIVSNGVLPKIDLKIGLSLY